MYGRILWKALRCNGLGMSPVFRNLYTFCQLKVWSIWIITVSGIWSNLQIQMQKTKAECSGTVSSLWMTVLGALMSDCQLLLLIFLLLFYFCANSLGTVARQFKYGQTFYIKLILVAYASGHTNWQRPDLFIVSSFQLFFLSQF